MIPQESYLLGSLFVIFGGCELGLADELHLVGEPLELNKVLDVLCKQWIVPTLNRTQRDEHSLRLCMNANHGRQAYQR